MGISLVKGGNISLTKEAGPTGLRRVTVGLGWDARSTQGAEFDLDASAFLLASDGKARSTADIVFYSQTRSACGAIEYQGDNRTGDAAGDDEQIRVDVTAIPADVARVAFTVTIYEGDERRQNFGMVSNAYIRVVDETNGAELVRYDLGEDYSTETALTFGELYRHGGDWKFKAIGQGVSGGLIALARNYGLNF
jgi:tellurium resistance protein TerD